MSAKEAQSEPSMEEILASIRRIISEEEVEAPKDAGPALELTQAAPPPADDDDLMVFDEEEPVMAAPAPLAIPEPAPMPRPAPAPAPAVFAAAPASEAPDGLVSTPVASIAAGAMTRLAGSIRIADNPGQSLEGVVREMLKPMLKDWLEQNLPTIVERQVEVELERIARLAR
ncbi:MAG: DUF2497 domain-containing protein [Caulobacterales bacterium]